MILPAYCFKKLQGQIFVLDRLIKQENPLDAVAVCNESYKFAKIIANMHNAAICTLNDPLKS